MQYYWVYTNSQEVICCAESKEMAIQLASTLIPGKLLVGTILPHLANLLNKLNIEQRGYFLVNDKFIYQEIKKAPEFIPYITRKEKIIWLLKS